ncbi:MAG TPA: YHS domain-containing protein [Rhodanobacteraceae bacterium]|nr:YHS domain-containing protein [Rhodanobacteraceae bacterium]
MSALVVALLVFACVVAVGLLLTYVALFVTPKIGSGSIKPFGDIGYAFGKHLLDPEPQHALPPQHSVDPVCGREAPLDGLHSHAYNGHVYYFCSDKCCHDFARRPRAYVNKKGLALVRRQRSFAHFR